MRHLPPSPERFHWTSGAATINIPGALRDKNASLLFLTAKLCRFSDLFCELIRSARKPECRQERQSEALSDGSFCDWFARDFPFPHGHSKLFQRRINTRLHEEVLIADNVGVEWRRVSTAASRKGHVARDRGWVGLGERGGVFTEKVKTILSLSHFSYNVAQTTRPHRTSSEIKLPTHFSPPN